MPDRRSPPQYSQPPDRNAVFYTSAFHAPATGVRAGIRLLGYQLGHDGWRRMWIDETKMGFWAWRQHGDIVPMAAELELAARHVSGQKLWIRFVEPPWSYQVWDDLVRLDVMGTGAWPPRWAGFPGRAQAPSQTIHRDRPACQLDRAAADPTRSIADDRLR
jgi:hypothetical protein